MEHLQAANRIFFIFIICCDYFVDIFYSLRVADSDRHVSWSAPPVWPGVPPHYHQRLLSVTGTQNVNTFGSLCIQESCMTEKTRLVLLSREATRAIIQQGLQVT